MQSEVELLDVHHLWGNSVPETEKLVKKGLAQRATIASVGPGDENLVRYAAILSDTHCAAARCSLGSVIRAKQLTAVVFERQQPVQLPDRDRFQVPVAKQRENIDDSILMISFDTDGTDLLADMVNAWGGYPMHNWERGTFAHIDPLCV